MDRKLPDWLKESREAEKLIAWLKSPDCPETDMCRERKTDTGKSISYAAVSTGTGVP